MENFEKFKKILQINHKKVKKQFFSFNKKNKCNMKILFLKNF